MSNFKQEKHVNTSLLTPPMVCMESTYVLWSKRKRNFVQATYKSFQALFLNIQRQWIWVRKKVAIVPEEGYFLYAKKETLQSPQIHNEPHPVSFLQEVSLS